MAFIKLSILTGVVGILCSIQVLFANQKKITPIQYTLEQKYFEPNSVESSGLTWGLHEGLKNCIPCHNSQPERGSSENASLIKPVPELCYVCHKDIGTKDQWWHGPAGTGECLLLCHEPHKTDNKSLLKKPVPELCYQCHEIKLVQAIDGHSDKSYIHCDDCHENHAGSDKMLLKQNFYKSENGLSFFNRSPLLLPQSIFIDSRDSLTGLQSVSIELIVDGSESLMRYGISEDLIRARIEQCLQKAGIKILSDKKKTGKQPSLQIQLRLMDVPLQQNSKQATALSGSFNIDLRQTVGLFGFSDNNENRFCTATTWNTNAIFLWGPTQTEEGLNKAIEVLMGQFCRDYTIANNLTNDIEVQK